MGTRLGPLTASLPKPLVPIGDEGPVLEIVLRQLAQQGFSRITIAIGHLGALNELEVIATLGGLEIALRECGVPLQLGAGVAACQGSFCTTPVAV